MVTKKIDKTTAIKSILSDLKKGIDKKTILQKLSKNYSNSTKTFYNYYEEADKQYQEFVSIAAPIVREKEIEALGKIAVSNIMSKYERQILLSEMARGEKLSWKEAISKDGIEILNAYDPLKYIAELNKMDGSYTVDEKPKEERQPITFRIISND